MADVFAPEFCARCPKPCCTSSKIPYLMPITLEESDRIRSAGFGYGVVMANNTEGVMEPYLDWSEWSAERGTHFCEFLNWAEGCQLPYTIRPQICRSYACKALDNYLARK